MWRRPFRTIFPGAVFVAHAHAMAGPVSHLRLVDPLDRPADGYCVDVVGTPGNLRTDLPLFAHNCKPGLSSDSAVSYESNGSIRFVEPGLCMTVAGINSQALPGASVLLQPCGAVSPFFSTKALQIFNLHDDGRLELGVSGLCLTVGKRSAVTYSVADRWRSLFVDDCASVEAVRLKWKFALPAE